MVVISQHSVIDLCFARLVIGRHSVIVLCFYRFVISQHTVIGYLFEEVTHSIDFSRL